MATKIDTVEKLAIIMVEGFASIDARFDAVDARFDGIEGDLSDIKRTLDRIDTRISTLELAVFGASSSNGSRATESSMLKRLDKLERKVFRS